MTTTRWRGTLIYTGTLLTIGTVAAARFAPFASEDQPDAAAPAVVAPSPTASAPSATATQPPSTAASPSPTETATPAPGSTTADTVTIAGSVSQTRYGPVQVSVTFAGTTIVDVQTLQSPSTDHESANISQWSTPVLAQEVLDAQSAQIDTVSGATYTSKGYRESVQSAIDQVS